MPLNNKLSKEKELAKNTAIILCGKICTQLVSFFLLPLYTAVLSTEDYGTVDLILTYSSLLLPIVTLAIEQALFRSLMECRNNVMEQRRIITTAIIFTIIQGSFITLVLFLIQMIIHSQFMGYFVGVLLATTASSMLLQLERGLGDNLGYTLGSTVTAIGQILFNIIFLVFLGYGAEGMMIAAILGNILCVAILLFRSRIYTKFCMKTFNIGLLKEMLNYSIPLIPNQLSWWVLNASDKVIVQFFIGVAGNGLLAVATKFSSVYTQFSNIFSISWTESAAIHFHDKDAEQFFSDTISTVFTIFMSICCGIIVSMPFAYNLLVDFKFCGAYKLIPIFMLSALFNTIVSLFGVIYIAFKKTSEIAKTAVFAAGVNLISHFALVKFIGLYAAPVSTVIGYGVMAVYRYWDSKKYMDIRFNKSVIVSSCVMILISFLTYYINIKAINIIGLFSVLFGSIYLNRSILVTLFSYIRSK